MSVKFYKVGGWVRDQFLGVKSKDLDYSVEAPSYEAMREEIVRRGGVIFLEKPEYVTIRAKVGKEAADFVLCRKDGYYSDGRRPDAVMPGTLMDDLARRDFTMNAMAISEGGVLHDPFNGRRDMQAGVIRCVGVDYDRFSEDSLRMLRAIRFAITKDMILDADIDMCLRKPALLAKLEAVSEERKREELVRCFKHSTVRTLDMLNEYHDLMMACFGKGGNLWLKPTSEQ
jgi:tRNA nucleotidyltransferase (CCA-adding enzyme)